MANKTYHTKQRYPSLDKRLPTKQEISKVKDLATYLFEETLIKLNINKKEITNV